MALQPVPKLSLQTGHYIMDYLAACAGAELGAPAARPEYRPLPDPLQTAGLQFLQGARPQSARGLCRVARHHFIMSPFDSRTPFCSILNTHGNTHNEDELLRYTTVAGGRR